MKTFCVANQKGGVGKSTVTVNCTYAAIERKLRVLLVDLDPQGNSSSSFPNPNSAKQVFRTASSLFSVEESAFPVERISECLSVIRADHALSMVVTATNDELKLPRKWLQKISADYDLCLIDTPPALGVLLGGALTASNSVITPMQIGKFEMQGVEHLFGTIKRVKRELNPKLRHAGILLVKTNSRSREETEALATLREAYGSAILAGTLPERAAVKASVALMRPVWKNVRGSSHRKAAEEWHTVCNEIIDGVLDEK